jgi:hypothetical protein
MEGLNDLGELIDKADNFLEYGSKKAGFARLPITMRLDALTTGLEEIRAEVKRLYLANGGTDEWMES